MKNLSMLLFLQKGTSKFVFLARSGAGFRLETETLKEPFRGVFEGIHKTITYLNKAMFVKVCKLEGSNLTK